MKTVADRRTILRSNRLENAPPAVQELFWRRYNQARSRRRPPLSLQELLDVVTKDSRLQPAEPLDEVAAAWQGAVPEEFQKLTRVEGLSGGRLRVAVDSAATRYVLGRQMGQTLIDALNTSVGSQVVQRIDFRLGLRTEGGQKISPPCRGLKR